MDKIFFHIDVNSAFLSWSAIERLKKGDGVDLRVIPSIIGGDQSKRHGIVLAKSIPAKKYGISTAEPIVNAFKKCPTLVMEPPDMAMYRESSKKFVDFLLSLTPDVEQASIDECYLFFTPIAHMYESPESAADYIRTEIMNRFGFTVNVGISDKKVLAKMASDFTKPNKTHTLYSHEIQRKMWPLPVGDLFLCGKSAQECLRKLDIKTIGELANADLEILTSHLKSHGKTLWEFANGIDDSEVITEPPETKGVGNSTTAEHDVVDRNEALEILLELCESVAGRLHKQRLSACCVTVEIKYATFKSVSRQTVTRTPISTAKAIHNVCIPLFDSLWSGEPIRLLGVRTTKLSDESEPVQLSLFDMENGETSNVGNDTKQRSLEDALATIRARFGDDAVTRGIGKR